MNFLNSIQKMNIFRETVITFKLGKNYLHFMGILELLLRGILLNYKNYSRFL